MEPQDMPINKTQSDEALALRAKVIELEKKLLHACTKLGWAEGPHAGPESCPTYYNGCHCLVETLVYNIERAQKAEARLKEYEEDGLKVLNEKCESDEHHCACVPDLHDEISTQKNIAGELAADLKLMKQGWSKLFDEHQAVKASLAQEKEIFYQLQELIDAECVQHERLIESLRVDLAAMTKKADEAEDREVDGPVARMLHKRATEAEIARDTAKAELTQEQQARQEAEKQAEMWRGSSDINDSYSRAAYNSIKSDLARKSALLDEWILAATSHPHFGRVTSEVVPWRLKQDIAKAVDYMDRVQQAELGLVEATAKTEQLSRAITALNDFIGWSSTNACSGLDNCWCSAHKKTRNNQITKDST